MNLLTAVNQALAEIGLSAQPSLIGNSQTDAVQTLAIAQAVGMDLARQWDWQALENQYTFNVLSQTISATTTSGSNAIVLGSTPSPSLDGTYQVSGTGIPQDCYVVSQVGTSVTLSQPCTASGTSNLVFGKTKYPFPSDYDRLIDRTAYDKSRRWAAMGPASPQEWEWLKSSYISTGPRIRWRIWQNYIQTWPLIATSDLLSFEYVSNKWAIDISGNQKYLFSADTDSFIWPDRLFITAFKARYSAQRGLEMQWVLPDYKAQLDIAKALDKSSDMLTMTNQRSSILIDITNVPDGGYGQ